MLEKIKAFVNQLENINKNNIDATRFNDQVAMLTDWEPLNTSSSNFNARKLTTVGSQLLQYKTTVGMKLFSGLFILVGAAFLSFVGPRQHGRWLPESFVDEGLAQLICLFFIAFGISMLYFTSTPIVFDGIKRVLIKGRGKKSVVIGFSDIYTLQLIPKYVSSSDGPDYYNFQLNIVFNDGERINIANYSNADTARRDSRILSTFIDKEVWDALMQE